jgi:hypothetical protein
VIRKLNLLLYKKKQWEALDRALYLGMTAQEAQEYEERGRRIVELQRTLGVNLNIPPLKKPTVR